MKIRGKNFILLLYVMPLFLFISFISSTLEASFVPQGNKKPFGKIDSIFIPNSNQNNLSYPNSVESEDADNALQGSSTMVSDIWINSLQIEALKHLDIMISDFQPVNERIDSALRLVELLNQDLLEYSLNFTSENGKNIILGLRNFCIDNTTNEELIEKIPIALENIFLTTQYEDIAKFANDSLLYMQKEGVELSQFFAFEASEFARPLFTESDKGILPEISNLISGDNIKLHTEVIQDIRTVDSNIPSLQSDISDQYENTIDYLWEYLSDLGIDVKLDLALYVNNIFGEISPPFENIVAVIPGETYPEKKIVICAHYDSINHSDGGIAPGANDNASGVAIALEVIRALKDSKILLDYTVEIVLFDAEEIGSYGSQAYVRHNLIEGEEIIGAINLDCVGVSSEVLSLYGNNSSEIFLETVAGIANDFYSDLEITTSIIDEGWSDQDSFWNDPNILETSYISRGFYSAIMAEGRYDNIIESIIHSADDRVENLD
ncbi:MAG: M20/M25/M40 family metallo-hydrolase [Candidatus Kaelpia imicola]|nr:M20/M25/M40 family metallo-hydrolase [Candidatus Kaelpia imicola]